MKKWLTVGLVFSLTFLVVGEIDFRWVPHQQRLSYQVDDNLLWRLSPNQQGFEWLAQMSQKSPPIKINNQGYRGDDFPNQAQTQVKILAVGSSSTLGTGVAEGKVWHQRLQDSLTDIGYPVFLYNGANPGWGPFQHAAFLEQEINKIQPDLLLVFINHQDLQFKPKSGEEKEIYLENARKRKQLLSISPFLTYSLRKIESFIIPVRSQLHALFSAKPSSDPTVTRPEELFAMHTPSWQRIIRLGARHQIPLVFFIPNVLNDPLSHELEDYLKQLANSNPLVTTHSLTSSEPLTADTKQALEKRYLIAHDGHPNAAYHQAMADDLLVLFINSHLASYLSQSPSLTLKDAPIEAS